MSGQMSQAQTVAFNAGAAEAGRRIADLEAEVARLEAMLVEEHDARMQADQDYEEEHVRFKKRGGEIDRLEAQVERLRAELDGMRVSRDGHMHGADSWQARAEDAEAEVGRLRAALQKVQDKAYDGQNYDAKRGLRLHHALNVLLSIDTLTRVALRVEGEKC